LEEGRMIRGLFRFLSGLSLLLCVTTVVLWVRSYGAGDVVLDQRLPDGSRWIFDSERGMLKASGLDWRNAHHLVAHRWVALATAVMPFASLVAPLLRRRVAKGHCARCGYDLRATPARCPECGNVPLAKGVA
jgi:hypothetical protein